MDSREIRGFYVSAHYMYLFIYFYAPILHMCIYAGVCSKARGGPLAFLLETGSLTDLAIEFPSESPGDWKLNLSQLS